MAINLSSLVTNPTQLCRAWVKFNGSTGVIPTGGSYNVTSVTKVTGGQFTITFTTPFSDTNYVITVGGSYAGTGNTGSYMPESNAINTSSCSIYYYASPAAGALIYVAVFGNQ